MVVVVVGLMELEDGDDHKSRILKSSDKPSYIVDEYEGCYNEWCGLMLCSVTENEKRVTENDDADDQ